MYRDFQESVLFVTVVVIKRERNIADLDRGIFDIRIKTLVSFDDFLNTIDFRLELFCNFTFLYDSLLVFVQSQTVPVSAIEADVIIDIVLNGLQDQFRFDILFLHFIYAFEIIFTLQQLCPKRNIRGQKAEVLIFFDHYLFFYYS